MAEKGLWREASWRHKNRKTKDGEWTGEIWR